MNRMTLSSGGLMPLPALMLCALAGVAVSPGAHGQGCEPGWVEGYVNAPTFNSEVRAVTYFEHGGETSLYAAGHFSAAGTTPISGIARWTGSQWADVGGGIAPAGGMIRGGYWLGVLDDGGGPDLYVSGWFDSAGGAPARNVARWDGQEWSALGAGTTHTVRMMTTYDDGSGPAIYAVGLFSAAGGIETKGIAKWDGTEWSAVGGGLQGQGIGYSINVHDLGDGPKLYVGGYFTLPTQGGTATNFARWDGTEWSRMGDGVFGPDPFVMVTRVVDYGEGPQLTIGGRFSLTPQGAQAARVARWTGTQWVQVGPALGNPVEYVNSLIIQRDASGAESLFVGGSFTNAVWLNNVRYVARLLGGEWVGVETGMGNWVRCLTVRPDGAGTRLVAAGAFEWSGTARANRVAEWDGSRWSGLETHRGLGGGARAAIVHDDGNGERLFVGGNLGRAGGEITAGVATWDGTRWDRVGGGVNGPVEALEVFDDGAGPGLYATGTFTLAGLGPVQNIARWDGQYWSSLAGSGPLGDGRCLAVFDGGAGPELIVGGKFPSVAGLPARGIARWNGAQWGTLGSGLGPPNTWYVDALAPFDDGAGNALYVGGYFSSVGGVSASGIARWDGANWANVGYFGILAGPWPGRVYDLRAWNGSLYAGGRFDSVSGLPVENIARWNGSAWTAFGVGQQYQPWVPYPSSQDYGVLALLGFDSFESPALWVGGSIWPEGSAGYGFGLTRWDGQWRGMVPALSQTGSATALASWDRGGARSLFVSGNFSTAGGRPAQNFAEWRSCPCAADCDGDGVLTVQDFGCFQTRFAAGEAYADCNSDTVLNLADFGCYQTKFAAGCP